MPHPHCATCDHWRGQLREFRGQVMRECRAALPAFPRNADNDRGVWPETAAHAGCAHHSDYPQSCCCCKAAPNPSPKAERVAFGPVTFEPEPPKE